MITILGTGRSKNYVYTPVYQAMSADDAPSPQVAYSNSPYPGYAAWKSFNLTGGTVGDGWSSWWVPREDLPVFLQIDLGSSKLVSRYNIQNCWDAGYQIASWQLQWSNNATDWTTVHTVVDDATNTAYAWKTTSPGFVVAGSGRYWRLRIVKPSGAGNNCACCQFVLYN